MPTVFSSERETYSGPLTVFFLKKVKPCRESQLCFFFTEGKTFSGAPVVFVFKRRWNLLGGTKCCSEGCESFSGAPTVALKDIKRSRGSQLPFLEGRNLVWTPNVFFYEHETFSGARTGFWTKMFSVCLASVLILIRHVIFETTGLIVVKFCMLKEYG